MPRVPAIHVSVNGDPIELPAGSTVADLLRSLELEAVRVAVEHNRRVLPRAEHGAAELRDGDQIEIVTFVGGG
jgi:thiamine biosynthesis protein ThiS